MKKQKLKVNDSSYADNYISDMAGLINRINNSDIEYLCDILWKAYENGRTIFIAGNGGSASTATHLAADIAKNTLANHWNENEKRFKILSLTDNVAWITAIGNDQSYENIYVEQLKNFAQEGDVLLVISASGNSPNIVKCSLWAKQKGIQTVGLLGFDGGYLKDFLDFSIIVESRNYGLVESVHGFIHHLVADLLMAKMRSNRKA